MKCKYCKTKIKNPKKNSVTCGKKECVRKYRLEYAKGDNTKEYNKNYQRISQRALWVLAKRHIKEFRKIRNKLNKEIRKAGVKRK